MTEKYIDFVFFGGGFIVFVTMTVAPNAVIKLLSFGKKDAADLNASLVLGVRICAAVAAVGCLVVLI